MTNNNNDKDKIVKVKRSDLQGLIDANIEAYNILDEIDKYADDTSEGIKRAFRRLEDVPTEISDMIVEDEDVEEADVEIPEKKEDL